MLTICRAAACPSETDERNEKRRKLSEMGVGQAERMMDNVSLPSVDPNKILVVSAPSKSAIQTAKLSIPKELRRKVTIHPLAALFPWNLRGLGVLRKDMGNKALFEDYLGRHSQIERQAMILGDRIANLTKKKAPKVLIVVGDGIAANMAMHGLNKCLWGNDQKIGEALRTTLLGYGEMFRVIWPKEGGRHLVTTVRDPWTKALA